MKVFKWTTSNFLTRQLNKALDLQWQIRKIITTKTGETRLTTWTSDEDTVWALTQWRKPLR